MNTSSFLSFLPSFFTFLFLFYLYFYYFILSFLIFSSLSSLLSHFLTFPFFRCYLFPVSFYFPYLIYFPSSAFFPYYFRFPSFILSPLPPLFFSYLPASHLPPLYWKQISVLTYTLSCNILPIPTCPSFSPSLIPSLIPALPLRLFVGNSPYTALSSPLLLIKMEKNCHYFITIYIFPSRVCQSYFPLLPCLWGRQAMFTN